MIGAGAASGGVMDASNLIKPVLTNGEIRCIGSTTYQEYRGIFEKDHALARRFQKIDVVGALGRRRPSRSSCGLKPRFEEHHGVTYADEALQAAAELAAAAHQRRASLPDKAIDVVDEAGRALRLKPDRRARASGRSAAHRGRRGAHGAHPAEERVDLGSRGAARTSSATSSSSIFGQDKAIDALAAAIKMARSGLGDQRKPVGSFLFAGPDRRRQDRGHAPAGARHGRRVPALRHVGVHGAPHGVAR